MDKLMPEESHFQSWAYWRSKFLAHNWQMFFHKQGYVFPDHPWVYEKAMRKFNVGLCIFCQGHSWFTDESDGRDHWCICALLDWQEEFTEVRRTLSSFIERKSLEDMDVWGKSEDQKRSLQNAIAVTRNWIKNPVNWVVYLGNAGCGKTHLASAILAAYDPIAIFITVGDLKQKLFDAMKDKEEVTVGDVVDSLKHIPLLILDDWGMEQGGQNGWISTQFTSIVNFRYNRKAAFPTIVTTNMLDAQLFGVEENKRAADRIMENGNYKLQILTGSYRRRSQSEKSIAAPGHSGKRVYKLS